MPDITNCYLIRTQLFNPQIFSSSLVNLHRLCYIKANYIEPVKLVSSSPDPIIAPLTIFFVATLMVFSTFLNGGSYLLMRNKMYYHFLLCQLSLLNICCTKWINIDNSYLYIKQNN